VKLVCLQVLGRVWVGELDEGFIHLLDVVEDGITGAARLGVVAALTTGSVAPRANMPPLRLEDADLMAPVPVPPRVFGVGLNYRDHALETGREPPIVQTWFMKQPTSVTGPFANVALPGVSSHLDFEVELVVVIGRGGRHIPEDQADQVIAGYCVGCDYSVRDWQRATPTMTMGKGFDTHAPFGPWLTTPDETGVLSTLRLTCDINGQRMQDGSAGDLIFTVPQLIAHLSKMTTLLPGDVIFTGTPAGVGVARTPPLFLRLGDEVVCGINRLGVISNQIVAEDPTPRYDGPALRFGR
jgi:2-keto-4-pentenoate hydratase/2-oxohepta-3-ene-1,7-dioic acid hydratase in catechol pathway